MKTKISLFFSTILMLLFWFGCNCDSQKITLKEAFKDDFYIGTALNTGQIEGKDTAAIALIKQQFNSVVAENCMKSEVLQPKQGEFKFGLADKFVEFGMANSMFIVGHALVWHAQAPKWFFVDESGNDVSRDTLIERMRNHIFTVVTRYKGRVNGWDVVNEAVDDGEGLRNSKWRQIIGDDYIKLAFRFANEADPDAELYYNDYNLYKPNKRAETVKIVKNLQQKGLRVDAVGMQAHYGLVAPDLTEMETSIEAFSKLGVSVMFTEFDVTVVPFPQGELTADIKLSYKNDPEYNPYPNGLPDSIQIKLANRYADFFKIFVKHRESVSRITFWGVNDGDSWRNYWPIRGRTDYPLLFDRNNQPKPAFEAVIETSKK